VRARGPARGRLVQIKDRWTTRQAGGQIQAAAHSTGVGLNCPSGGFVQLELRQQLLGALLRHGLRKTEQPTDQQQVLGAGQLLID
jgi:hypothetical protein